MRLTSAVVIRQSFVTIQSIGSFLVGLHSILYVGSHIHQYIVKKEQKTQMSFLCTELHSLFA